MLAQGAAERVHTAMRADPDDPWLQFRALGYELSLTANVVEWRDSRGTIAA